MLEMNGKCRKYQEINMKEEDQMEIYPLAKYSNQN